MEIGGKVMGGKNFSGSLAGIFAPITTPFSDGSIDYSRLGENIEKYNTTGLKGYMPLGSNGEYLGLTDREALSLLEVVQVKKAKDKVILAGCGRESSQATLEFIRYIYPAGIDFAVILTPHYYSGFMTENAIEKYFFDIADHSPAPVVVYNAPKFTGGLSISPELTERLAEHENIAGFKNSSDEPVGNYAKHLKGRTDFALLAGNIGMLYSGIMQGAVGGVCSTATWLPEYCAEIYSLIAEGKLEKAKSLYDFICDVSSNTAGKYGVAGVKCAMDIRGFFGGRLRLPLLSVSDDLKEYMSAYIYRAGIPAFPANLKNVLVAGY